MVANWRISHRGWVLDSILSLTPSRPPPPSWPWWSESLLHHKLLTPYCSAQVPGVKQPSTELSAPMSRTFYVSEVFARGYDKVTNRQLLPKKILLAWPFLSLSVRVFYLESSSSKRLIYAERQSLSVWAVWKFSHHLRESCLVVRVGRVVP